MVDGVLTVEGLQKTFGGVVALDEVDFAVQEGLITGIIGPNGAGKTTLYNVISGIIRPDEGRISLHGEEIQDLSSPEIAVKGLGRTFQTPRVFNGMSVRENLAFAPQDQTGESVVGVLFQSNRVKEEEESISTQVSEMLEFLELDHLEDEYARELSGGQRKLLELGRTLMTDPDILLLDEPMAGVNPSLTDHLLDRLHHLNDEGMTIVIIEHDMDIIMNHCDRIVVLHEGATLATGTPEEIQDDIQVLEAYLGGGVDD